MLTVAESGVEDANVLGVRDAIVDVTWWSALLLLAAATGHVGGNKRRQFFWGRRRGLIGV